MNQHSIDCASQLNPDLWSICNLFTHDELSFLLHKISQHVDWKDVDLQTHLNRQQVAWQDEGILDWLWSGLSCLDFSRFGVKFRTVMIWRDLAGYMITNHADNDQVHAAMQIYLSDTHRDLGTWFDPDIEIPFVQNTGYFMHNRHKIIHGMKNSVPLGYNRISFYALFDPL
jgi:hypothetical protein